MVSIEAIAAIVFVVLLSLFLFIKRKNLKFQPILGPLLYFAMYKTKWGLNWMDHMAKKWPKTIRFLAIVGVYVGFLGMIFIAGSLIWTIFKSFTTPEAVAGVGLVLPIKAKGVFYVPFFYWIICIFVIAVVHEFAHGVVARAVNLKVKASGFAFLGALVPIIPAAFVEPDEHELNAASKKKQLMVFAAGPFSNVLLAALTILVLIFAAAPIAQSMTSYDGVEFTDIQEGLAAEAAGLQPGTVITAIDGNEVSTLDEFTAQLKDSKPGDTINLTANESIIPLTLTGSPDDENRAYLGVFVAQKTSTSQTFKDTYGSWTASMLLWIFGLLNWMYILNLGIGLFNLVPLGPIDGGRMLKTGLEYLTSEKNASAIWKYTSFFFLAIILASLTIPYF